MGTRLSFNLSLLSDRMINVLLRGAGEQPDRSPLIAAVVDILIGEQLRRLVGKESWPVELPDLTPDEIRHVYANLTTDVITLAAAALMAGDSPEAEELRTAAAFLDTVGKTLLTGTGTMH